MTVERLERESKVTRLPCMGVQENAMKEKRKTLGLSCHVDKGSHQCLCTAYVTHTRKSNVP